MDVRTYDPAIGRFNGIDPIRHFSQGTSVAFDNNPVFWADPSGADSKSRRLWGQLWLMNAANGDSNDRSWEDAYYLSEEEEEEENNSDSNYTTNKNGYINLPPVTINQGNNLSYRMAAYKTAANIMGLDYYDYTRPYFSQRKLSITEEWSNSNNIFASVSYGILNDGFQALQTVDGDLISGRTNPLTGARANINIDGSANYTPAEGMVNTMSFAIPIARGTKAVSSVLPKGLGYIKKLNAAQFSQRFKGNLSKLIPKYRGVINRYLNKGINSYNNQMSNGMITLKALMLKSDEE